MRNITTKTVALVLTAVFTVAQVSAAPIFTKRQIKQCVAENNMLTNYLYGKTTQVEEKVSYKIEAKDKEVVAQFIVEDNMLTSYLEGTSQSQEKTAVIEDELEDSLLTAYLEGSSEMNEELVADTEIEESLLSKYLEESSEQAAQERTEIENIISYLF